MEKDQTSHPDPIENVGGERHSHIEPLTDEGREEAIVRAGNALTKAYAAYTANKSDATWENAQRASRLMAQLILGRSPAQVARMEAERGLT